MTRTWHSNTGPHGMYLSACCTMCCTRGRRGSLRARAPGQLTLRHAFQRHISTQLSRAWGRREPLSQRWEDAHPDCSRGLVRLQLRLDTLVGAPLRPPYQWRRGSLRARAPGQHSGTPSRGISTHARVLGHVSMGETMLTRHPCHHGQGHATTAGVSTRRKRMNTANRAKSMSTRIGRFANDSLHGRSERECRDMSPPHVGQTGRRDI